MPEETERKLRRLRFDLEPHADESVPGAIARGVAGHHLVRLSVVLRESRAGRRGGLVQLADPEVLTRVAQVIRYDPEYLISQAGRRLVEPGDRRLQHFVDFDGLILPRSHIELRRRRVSPLALLNSDHHRQPWLMAVLPFCPETLEHLVDTCPFCGFVLGWVEAAGIGRCESCLKTVPPSTLPALADDLAEDYRLYAKLISLRPSDRAEAVSTMPPRLQQLQSGELARFAMRCGLDCHDGDEKRAWLTRAGKLPAERIAETAARGIALLRSWPEGISSWAADRLALASNGSACRRDLRRRIRRIAWGDSGFSDQRSLLREIFPNLEALRKRPEQEDSFYTGREVNSRLSGFRTYAAEIRKLGIVPHQPAPDSGDAIKYLYPAAIIDASAGRMADSMSISSIVDQLQLPLYAIEQFFEAGLLAAHDDPLLAIMLRRPLAVASTYDDLVRRMKARRSRKPKLGSALPISRESHRIGGTAKPWSDIYEALLAGHIPFWPDGGVGADRLLVARGSLDGFIGREPRPAKMAAPDMSTGDAAELLNLIPGAVRKLRSAHQLPHATGPRAKVTPRAEVEKLAAKYVSGAEMAQRTRLPAFHVNNRLRSLGFESFHGLWNRDEALDALPLR